jgi:hypothetical protein
MTANSFHDLLSHRGHEVEVAVYGPADDPLNAAIECLDCGEVLLDFDADEDEDAEDD